MTRHRGAALLAAGAAALALAVAPAPASASVSASASSTTASALTKERLYELARGRAYGTPVPLDVPGFSLPTVLTDSGVVVGTTDIDGVSLPFRWRDGRAEVWPARGADYTTLVDVNERGQVLVQELRWAGPRSVLVWQPDGTVVQVAPEAPWWSAYGISDDGTVVGVRGTRVVTWRDGVVTELTGPGGQPAEPPVVVNGPGDVAAVVGSRVHVWRDGVPAELPAPAGAESSPVLITDGGDVVGYGGGGLVIWEGGGPPRAVDRNGWFGLITYDANERGVVVGRAGRWGLSGPVRSNERGVAAFLPGLGGSGGVAHAVHDLDVVVGSVPPQAGAYSLPVMWVLTVPVPLGHRVDGVAAVTGAAVDINRSGRVLGWLTLPRGDGRNDRIPVLWDLMPRR